MNLGKRRGGRIDTTSKGQGKHYLTVKRNLPLYQKSKCEIKLPMKD